MKKILSTICLLLVLCSLSFAQMAEYQFLQFGANGSLGASTTLPDNGGYIFDKSMYISVATNADMTMYMASEKTQAFSASSTTNLVLYTTSSNVVKGNITLTTDDYVLIRNASGGWQLGDIDSIGVYTASNNATAYGLAATNTVTAKDPVFIIDSENIDTFPCLASDDQTDLRDVFVGKKDMPVHLSIPASAGTTIIGGVYAIVR